jgi:hypothetical protein
LGSIPLRFNELGRLKMGILKKLIYAYLPDKVKESVKIDELKKQNDLLAKMVEKSDELRCKINK